ncbi:hypothetical protein KIW84_024305 [Lathyrus oleraceus]|uniref:Chromo domain-containing protein n=1 Tax=Pisum sativum TaxID=3888 RepID=A0A9D4YF93_PEA|nr:hypothetical protein KIW84_024305 [Pisum sativum]
MHDSLELQSLLHYPTWLGFDEVLKEVHVDVVLQKIITTLEKGEQTKPWFSYRRGVLFYEGEQTKPWFSYRRGVLFYEDRVVAYQLKLPDATMILPVFHYSLLKKAIGNYRVEKELPSGLDVDPGGVWEPAKVLATRSVTKDKELVQQLLIHWKCRYVEEATWEGEFNMRSQFPAFKLEDKSADRSIDRDGMLLAQPNGP